MRLGFRVLPRIGTEVYSLRDILLCKVSPICHSKGKLAGEISNIGVSESYALDVLIQEKRFAAA